jgi:uncharacterized protein
MLQKTVDLLVYSFFNMNSESNIGKVLNFFIYDSVKILLLLFVMISIIGFIRSYLSQDKVKKWIANKGIFGNLAAACFGALTPFCSCSSIPIFLSFLKAGIPLGVTFSFLITSPLVNEYLVVLMLGFFGIKITFFYVISGVSIGVICGGLLGRMNLEKLILIKEQKQCCNKDNKEILFKGLKSRIVFGVKESLVIIKKLWLWILLGVGIGAFIHNYVPREVLLALIGKAGIFAVPVAVLLGVPMYGSCAAIVPIAMVLFNKGVPLGVALAFMMAISALSLPEAIILKSAMKLKLIIAFFSITTISIIIIGYLFNLL